MKRVKPFWIKKRYNPQSGVYYVACGQLSKTAAKRKEKSLYGFNEMLEFATETEYLERLDTLRRQKESVQRSLEP